MAIAISFMGLSSAAMRLECIRPQTRHRWMTAHSPFFAHPDRDGVHHAVAGGCPVAGFLIQMDASQTVGAVIAVVAPGPGRHHQPPQTRQVKGSGQGCFCAYPLWYVCLLCSRFIVIPPQIALAAHLGGELPHFFQGEGRGGQRPVGQDSSRMGLSSSKWGEDVISPHRRQRWMISQRSSGRIQTLMGRSVPPHAYPSAFVSCTPARQLGQ